MKVELHSGQSFDVPDSMSEDQVQAIVNVIVRAEITAKNALDAAHAAQDSVAELQRRLDTPQKPVRDDTAVLSALAELRLSQERGFDRLVAAMMADTVLVDDNLHAEPNRTRKELR